MRGALLAFAGITYVGIVILGLGLAVLRLTSP
jgi:hypothetical protein